MSHAVLNPARIFRFGRRRRLVLTLTAAMAASVVFALDMPVAAEEAAGGPAVEQVKILPHTEVPLARLEMPKPAGGGERKAQAWPAGGSAEASLPRAEKAAKPRQAGDLPIALAATTEGTVDVRLADQAGAQRAGVTGLLFSLGARRALSTSVTVDYSSFRYAGGADLGSRLRLVGMPACALTTPEVAECQVHTPLPSRNDGKAQTVSADVALGAEKDAPVVLAAVADSSGPQGTFEVSSLAPAGSWSVGGSTGGFSWSYPISVPPVAAGSAIAPSVNLGYGSSGVDGRTLGTNNQPSWVGQGWDYTPGSIERTYRGCVDDEGLPEAQRTNDMCWAGHIVTMNLGGQSVPLVYDDNGHTWHAADDSGAKVELLPGAANDVVNGEHWKVTTIDGTQYWFGRDRGPGYINQEQTNSAWTVPVYGPRAGNPCHNPAGFAQSSCKQAWRWNLDFVEDVHGAVTAYYYTPETGYYGANRGTTGVEYVRGGSLKRIDYGLRKVNGSIYGQTVPGQVVFDVTERCNPTPDFNCDPALFTAANAKKWPDTPHDQQCLPGAVCNNHSPSFWTTKRLSTITTRYDVGAGPVTVDTYQLTQSFPSLGNPALQLDKIVRTGHAPGTPAITLPPITFEYELRDNRVPGYNSLPAMAHWRLKKIGTDTGAIVTVTYNRTECAQGNMPADPAHNNKLCFPVNWHLPFNEEPTLDYFHKYVVTKVETQDRNALSPTKVTSYHYVGTPAWHYDDNELVKPKYRTYGQFRGYQQVEVRTGGPDDTKTLTRTTYYRGMDDDIMPGPQPPREITFENSRKEVVDDHNLYAGEVHEVQTFLGDTNELLSTTTTDKTVINTTATRNRPGLRPLTANVVDTQRRRATTTLAAGGDRTATTTHAYDAMGRKIATTESGTGIPDVCTTVKYAENTTTAWIRDRAAETITSQQVCPTPGTAQSSVLAVMRTYYDGSTTLGAIPDKGNATCTEKAVARTTDGPVPAHPTCRLGPATEGTLVFAAVGRIGYDSLGRVTVTTDANQHVSRTDYLPVDAGIVSKTVITNPKNQTATSEHEPSRGLVTANVDVGGRRTDATYDALGRLVALWKPGRPKGQVEADVTHAYRQETDKPLAVTTKSLVDYGEGTNYLTKVDLFDALGQLRQTQVDDVSDPAGVTNRVVKDVFYDSHGWAVRSNNRYATTGAPDPTIISLVGDAEIDDRTVIDHDGAGRVVKSTSYEGHTKKKETRTIHGGDRITVIPPQGGVTRTTIADIRGQDTEIRQYTAPPTVTGNVVSAGEFESTTLRYTPLGQLAGMTDDAGNQWSYDYDILGRQTKATDPDSGTTRNTYDLAGRVTATTDARGQTLAFAYDALGRKTAEHNGSLAGTKLAEWFYDTATNGVGLFAGNRRGNYAVWVTGYNGAGLPNDHTVQIPDAQTGLSGTHKTNYGYTSTGLPQTVEPVTLGGLPGEIITTKYDRYGQPKSTLGYNSIASASTYTPYGEPSQYVLGFDNTEGKLTYDYDKHTRALNGVNLSVRQAWAQIDDLRYTRDDAGNITRIVNVQGHPDNNAPTRTQCFDYDALNRLTEAWTATDNCAATPSASNVGGVNPYWTSWDINEIGLRESQTRHAIGTGQNTTTTYTYPPSGTNSVRPHALSSTTTNGATSTSYTYNAVGDVTTRDLPSGDQTLTWNENNRLATVTTPTGTTSYVYDADGNQLIRTDPDKTTLHLPMQDIVRNNTTGDLTGTRYYTHNGSPVAMRVAGNNPQYVQSDQHGTAQVTVTTPGFVTTRRTFDPYGNPVGTGQGLWPDNRGFLNMPHSQVTGLTDIGARKYDPTTGSFTSVDPVLDVENPQQWNPYAYSNNNPVTYSDPSGLYCDGCNTDNPNSPAANSIGCGLETDGTCGPNDHLGSADGDGPRGGGGGPNLGDGKNKDPSKQPEIAGNRVPTFEELKNLRPAGHGYVEGDTYADAVRDWAYNRCRMPRDFNAEFCAIAQSYGWLEPKNPALHQFLFGLTPIADLVDCVGGEESCLWILANFVPGAKAGKAIDEAIDIADTARDVGKACGLKSFGPGTRVLMADGTSKPIEDIGVGDKVLAADPETGERGARAVTAVWQHQDTVTGLAMADGAVVITTEDHPYWNVTDQQWQEAQDLDSGDHLLAADGRLVHVAGLRAGPGSAQEAYNLTVDDIHTYYVLAGDTPVLVHNTGPDECGSEFVSGGVENLHDGAYMATDDALETAVDFLGPGYRDMGGGRFLSGDGLRQVRMTDADLAHRRQDPHINFETYRNPIGPGVRGNRPSSNIHIYLPEEPGWHLP